MKPLLVLIAAVSLLSVHSMLSFATSRYASPGYIQATINVSVDGDSVILIPGVYNEADIDFHGKAITVTSQAGPDYTTISFWSSGPEEGGSGIHHDGFLFQSGEGPGSVLSGITVEARIVCHTGAWSIDVLCDGSSPTIQNMRLRFGTELVRCSNGASPTVRHCELIGDTYAGCYIGHYGEDNAITCTDSSPVIVDNTITRCGGLWGPAILCMGGSPLIERNLIFDNAGGIMVNAGTPVLSNNTVVNTGFGGGVWCRGGNPVIERCILAFNRGGGIVCEGDASPTCACNDLYGNTEGTADSLCGTDAGGNFSADPVFCSGSYRIDMSSPCMPMSSPCGQLVGALPAGCGANLITMTRPVDMTIPAGSQISSITLIGFSITNVDAATRTIRWEVMSPGLLHLDDRGDSRSLNGTRMLAPGEKYIPPMPALDIPVLRTRCEQPITYSVWVDDVPALFVETTVCVVEPPVPVLITSFDARAVQGGIALSWVLNADPTVKGFRIHRSLAGGGDARALGSGMLAPSARSYQDRDVVPGQSYAYVLTVVLTNGDEFTSPRAEVQAGHFRLALEQNTPNPFNPSTLIPFSLADATPATLSVYDIRGALVVTLVDRIMSAGEHTVTWNGRDAAGNQAGTGVYFCVLRAGKTTLTRKMVMLK